MDEIQKNNPYKNQNHFPHQNTTIIKPEEAGTYYMSEYNSGN